MVEGQADASKNTAMGRPQLDALREVLKAELLDQFGCNGTEEYCLTAVGAEVFADRVISSWVAIVH